MSSVFKTFLNNDVVPTRTLLHEAIPITGSLVSGTYADANIRNYSHGLFQSVYDYPFLSSSANHIFDLAVGYSVDSSLSASTSVQNSKKINMYNEMAQILMGHDATGSILQFDEDGNIIAGGQKIRSCFIVNFSRLISKDEVKKGSFVLQLGAASSYLAPFSSILTITDSGAQNDFRVNSPAGEYGILSASAGGAYTGNSGSCGLIFYQAGIAILTGSIFLSATGSQGGKLASDANMTSNGDNVRALLTGSSITGSADAWRHRLFNLQFNNTTELNSTHYFCRVNNNDYNYSSNPTYLSGSKIVVKNNTLDAPIAYITTVGLYSADNELLAVAKISEPLKKDPTNELNLKVRLDY